MAKSLIIYPYADVSIQHTKSNTSSTAAALVNEVNNSTNGYLAHNFSTASTTNVSSFSGLAQSSNVTVGKVRINSISSVNLYLALSKSSNATFSNINIFGTVSINGNTYQSTSYNPTGTVSTSLQTLSVSNANINRIYSSLSAANIQMSLSSSGRYTLSDEKSSSGQCRVYNANVTISYDDVFDCATQVIAGHGISNATVSSNEVVDGDNCTFAATVQSGYVFDGWYDNSDFDGDPISTDSTFTLRVIENTTLYPKAVEEGFVPPEEDPDKVYYPITISSINARTSPSKGTTSVESGSTKEIKITPKHPQLTLATDNGTDISSQLVGHGTPIQYPTIATAPNAAYGFSLDSSTNYYVSTNNGRSNTAAVCRLTFNLPVRCLVTIQYINYAEATYDYGIFGNIDSALSTASTLDSNVKLACNTVAYNISTPQTLTYEMTSGQHYIDIKYIKNGSNNSNNDNLQFKVLNIEALDVYDFYYTYELQGISQDHSLNFVFGDVQYFFVATQTDSNAKLYPYGQTVVLPGDEYRLTIVPENNNETVTLMDNDVDVSSQLQEIEVETEKEGETVMVVNYIYKLTNVQSAHTLSVFTTKQVIPQLIKLNGVWTIANFYAKVGGVWTQLSLADIYSRQSRKEAHSFRGGRNCEIFYHFFNLFHIFIYEVTFVTSLKETMVLKTFNIEIAMPEDVGRHWLNLLVQSRDAYNFCAGIAVSEKVPLSLKTFHDALYQRMREEFRELPAQAVIKVYKDVLAALRSIRSNKHREAETPHRESLSLQLDCHLYSRMGSDGIILSSGEERRRVLCPFKLYDKVRELFSTCPTKDPRIFYLDGRFFLSVPFEVPSLPCKDDTAIGVDLGMKRLFVTSEGNYFSDKEYLARRRKLRYLKRCLQGKGTKSAKKHLLKVRRDEHNQSKDMVERACNALLASTSASILVLEDLKRIKQNTSKDAEGHKRVRHNNAQSQVPYYLFKERLTQKAPLVGKRVETVSAVWTSQMDSRTSKRDGNRKGCRYYCSDGVVFDADHNAAVNIATRSKHPTSSRLPIDGKLVPLVGRVKSATRSHKTL